MADESAAPLSVVCILRVAQTHQTHTHTHTHTHVGIIVIPIHIYWDVELYRVALTLV